MEVHEYFQVLKKRWLLIFIITFAAASTGAGLSYFVIEPTYKSNLSVIVGNSSTDTSNQVINYDDVIMYQMLVKTYSELAKSRTLAENVINSLKLEIKPEELQKMVSVLPKGDTEFINISVRSKNAEQATIIANQVAKSLKELGIVIKKSDNIQILDPAQLPAAPDSPRPLINTAVAFLLGLIISVSLTFFLDYLDNTVKTQEDIEKLIGVPVIGVITYEP